MFNNKLIKALQAEIEAVHAHNKDLFNTNQNYAGIIHKLTKELDEKAAGMARILESATPLLPYTTGDIVGSAPEISKETLQREITNVALSLGEAINKIALLEKNAKGLSEKIDDLDEAVVSDIENLSKIIHALADHLGVSINHEYITEQTKVTVTKKTEAKKK